MPKARTPEEEKAEQAKTSPAETNGDAGATQVSAEAFEALSKELAEANQLIADQKQEIADLKQKQGEDGLSLTTIDGEKQAIQGELETANKIIGDQAKQIADLSAQVGKASGALDKAETMVETAQVATVAEVKEKLTRVKFLKPHEFVFGMKNVKALKGEEKEVDIFIANKLASRGIAVILN